jgi:dynein heavy chain
VPVLRRLELPEKTDEKPPEKKGAKVQPKESRAPEVRLRSNFNVDLLKVINEVAIWNKIQSLGMINMNVSIVRLLTESETLRKLRENVMMIVRDYNSIQDLIQEDERDLFAEHLQKLDGNGGILPGFGRFTW